MSDSDESGPYSKIKAGLEDALAYAQGDATRAQVHTPQCPHCGRDKRRAVIGRRGEVPCYWCGLLPSADHSALLPPEVRAMVDRMKAEEASAQRSAESSPSGTGENRISDGSDATNGKAVE